MHFTSQSLPMVKKFNSVAELPVSDCCIFRLFRSYWNKP